MAKKQSEIPDHKLAAYERLVATLPGVDRKGATMPYTSIHGNMFSYLSKSGTLSLRLPAGAREAFIQKYGTRLTEQYGIVQKEYVEVPDDLLEKTAELQEHFAASFAYVSALRPKPTTRKKRA